MAEEKVNKIEKENALEKKEAKKLEEFKETPENKEAIAQSEGKVVEKKETKSAVEKKDTKKESKKEEKIELEREYVIPIRKYTLTVPKYRRAKKAIMVVRKFLAKHMKVEEHNIKSVKIDMYLNNEIWFRGIKKPASKIKVKAIKKGGIVYAELADIPDVVKFQMEKDKRRSEKASAIKPKKAEHKHDHDHDHDHDHAHPHTHEETAEEKIDSKEKEKSSVEAGLAKQKQEANELKHTAKGSHKNVTAPRRKALKK